MYGPAIAQKPGEPYGNLRGIRLWMVYLHHRWAIDTATSYIGGMYHNFAVKGDSIPPTEIVPAAKQRELVGLLLDTLDPANLAIPERILASLTVAPAVGGEGGGRGGRGGGPNLENFEMPTGYAFDQLSAARTIAGLVMDQLFEPEKAARLISFADRQQGALTLPELIDEVSKKVWDAPAQGAAKSLLLWALRVFVRFAGDSGRESERGKRVSEHC